MAREPMPLKDRVARAADGLMHVPWINWLSTLTRDVAAAPQRVASVALTGQTAAISPTSLPIGTVSAGLYRVTYHVRVTTAATTSSSVTPVFGFTSGGVACVTPGTAVTGNTTATNDSHSFLIYVDAATAMTYSTSYASVGATSMAYELRVVAEKVNA